MNPKTGAIYPPKALVGLRRSPRYPGMAGLGEIPRPKYPLKLTRIVSLPGALGLWGFKVSQCRGFGTHLGVQGLQGGCSGAIRV